MGWFDDDDSDGEDEQKPKALDTPDDDEDPLDAYMKSLETPQSTQANAPPRPDRLDVENEDEGTIHWKERRVESEEDEIDAARQAHHALSSTFHKAGSKQTNVSIQLDVLRHDEIQYNSFSKAFLERTETPAGQAWRQQEGVVCTPIAFDPITSFQSIAALLGDVLERIRLSGYIDPTPVQAQTLAVALAGHDALVTASTGSGKTLAYVWPMIIHMTQQQPSTDQLQGPVGLVLVPTREIAQQVHKQVKSMTKSSIAITGGVNRYQLVQDLKRNPAHIVVATPGRLLDVLSIKKNGLSLHNVTFVVLDECDRMLDMGFESQVKEILNQVRPDRQSLLLSATLGRKIELVARQWLKNPIRIAIGQTGRASDHVQQHVMILPNVEAKKAWLQQMLPILVDVGLTLVFVATRVECEALAEAIRESNPSNLKLATLHGDKHATDRQDALRAFTKGQVSALIATDVAARGLDTNVATVISFDPAKNLDVHVHRIGRAGRLAKDEQEYREGTAYTLLTKKDADFAHVLMNSFERDGGEISPELRQLAQTSRRSGNSSSSASRDKWNKAGLGFADAPRS
ncbi:DEAD box helicase-like protein [Fragilaria crotonensis]|nr:DEAD box helicase-like protein [Fragilaria crotonensis]